MNLIKPTFLLCVFGSTTFVMSCSGNTPVAGCSNGTKDERNFFIPSGTDHCAPNDTRWCCPAGKLLPETSYKVGKIKKDGCQEQN
ncbi:hypothetical protein KEM48_001222 [Puccinia striiformis f. sp. tritici PST-130]|nr:hypothetical protein Pst134EB_031113 [Puccinia striiformis f. sp. tritici]KAI9601933.1 hypothetical protein KEM48_001222 [Puccinia striiformis f. sp. tritici PST-130]